MSDDLLVSQGAEVVKLRDGDTIESDGSITHSESDPWIKSEQLGHQVHASRYYVHQLRASQYRERVRRGEITVEQAEHMYALAMINYDQLMETCVSGSITEADQAEMDKGFTM